MSGAATSGITGGAVTNGMRTGTRPIKEINLASDPVGMRAAIFAREEPDPPSSRKRLRLSRSRTTTR